MTKLKCWKRAGKDIFKNKKEKNYIGVSEESEGYRNSKRIFSVWISFKNSNDEELDIFNKKSQALKFAKSYMKKHNQC